MIAAVEEQNPPIWSSTQQKNRVDLHSFLDKDLNTVYLVRWDFFCVTMTESEEQEPFPSRERSVSRRFETTQEAKSAPLGSHIWKHSRGGLG